jgi:hypothetical protein
MIERLIRLSLAFVVAFVFAGRMEAAAAHCARLAQAEAAAVEAPAAEEASPCHGEEMATETPAPQHHGKPAHHDKSGDRCECVGVLKGSADVAAASGSSHIEPYELARPQAAVFASIEPSPGLRPPRA